MRMLARLLVFLALAVPAHAQINGSSRGNVYYVSASGNDSNDGLSTSTPWHTIAKVNGFSFLYGDTVLFHGGDSFSGSVNLHWSGGGISSYGTGSATISSTTSACVTAVNLHDIFIDNLICTGSGAGVNTTPGISVSNTSTLQQNNIIVHGDTVSGYGGSGILLAGGQGGFLYASVSGNTVHDVTGGSGTGDACIQVGSTLAPSLNNMSNTVTISFNTVYNCLGHTGLTGNSGSGIILSEATGGTISSNIVHDYGTNNGTSTVGAWGIATFDSKFITISANEVYNGQSATNLPNSVFIGHNSIQSKILYNWVHGNAGPGIMWKTESGFGVVNIVTSYAAFNILQGNGGVGEIALNAASGTLTGTNIYNNTIYASLTTAAIWYHGASVFAGMVSNNIIQTAGSTVVLTNDDNSSINTTFFPFTGNDYTGTSTSYKNGATTYGSFAAWQAATNQEKIGGSNVGLTTSPALTNAGGGSTIGAPPPFNPTSLTAYMFATLGGSPMANVGINIFTQYPSNGQPVLKRDFYGNTLPTGVGTGYPVGANASSTH